MHKTIIALLLLALVAVGQQSWVGRHYLLLKEEAIRIEYAETSGEAALVVEAEIEDDLETLEVWAPDGQRIFSMQAQGGLDMALSGFVLETKEADLETQRSTFQTGRYAFRARTTEGRPVFGKARLYHELLPAPWVLYPVQGAGAPSEGFTVMWLSDPDAQGYEVVLEQGESDDITVSLPAGSSSFQVPPGVLQPGVLSHVEVGIVGRNGNKTFTEVEFTTW